jgi:hypothetical protein
MSAIPRQKACTSCADSKRRCDKQLPQCQRCLDRDVDCVYPQPKKRRRDSITRDSQPGAPFAFQNNVETDALGASFDLADWGTMEAADLDLPFSDVINPYIPQLPASVAGPSTQEVLLESGNISSTASPWFLRDETWVKHYSDHDPDCATNIKMEPFIRAVEEMLKFWVKNGYNSFIHRRLYEKGMPTCLQDAFTTFAAYTARTPAVKETILQIAEERSSALVCQSPPTAGGAEGILAQLARVQALFVYEFIRLFDGSVRLRASAEQQLPTLRRWVTEMWEAVKNYRGEDDFLGRRSLQWTANEFEKEYEASLKLWKLWILTESVRRSLVVIDTIANTYQTMTRGWAECTGVVMITGRRGLWEAESALKWFDLSWAASPLLVPCLQPEALVSQYAAEEFDDFIKVLWTVIIGADKIQCWIDRSNKTNRT